MKKGKLKKLNRADTPDGVQADIAEADFIPFEEGDIEGLSLMTVFKGREQHTARKKKTGGVYIKLQYFTGTEGYEDYDFLAVSADEKRRGRKGKRFYPLYCKIFYKKL